MLGWGVSGGLRRGGCLGEGAYAVGGGGFVAGDGGVDFALGVGDGVWVAGGHFWRKLLGGVFVWL